MNDLIGAYRILSEAGRGAYGVVYLVENTLSGQTLALKVLQGKQEKRELEGLIRYRECRHPNLLQIHHIDRLPDGRLYYTMDAADNRTSDGYEPDTLAERGRVAPSELLAILHALLDGLEELRRHHLVHRDIKPDNILFVHGVPVLGDIGLTAVSGHSSLVGTPYFMPPGVISGKHPPDEASDLFAVGRVAYVALTGMEPFQYPQLPADLPKDAAPILAFCRATNAENPSIDACRQALSTPPSEIQHHRKWLMPTIAVSVAAVCVLACTLLLIRGASSSVPKATASLMKPLSPDEFGSRLNALQAQFPPISEELANTAKARFDALQQEKATLLSQPFDGTPEKRMKISSLLEEKYKLFSKTDALYRLGELSQQIQTLSNAGIQSPSAETLNLLQRNLAERQRLAALCNDGAKLQ